MQRIHHWPLIMSLAVSLLLGGSLGHSTLAQSVGQAQDPTFFAPTGYRVTSPEILSYFQHRGGLRTFGYPVSSEFPLLGERVQIFQRGLLRLHADGSVTPGDVLDRDVLPITHIDGLSLPAADPDLLGAAPSPDSPDYLGQALSFVNVYVPDTWNGLPVDFQSAFLSTVTCADLGEDTCDPSELAADALEVWGLPTSLPTSDPLNDNFVYQRFQRGIMHFSRATGATQGLLVGDWLKRIMIGVDLPADLSPAVRQSRLYAQYAPSRPLALDRPADLPDTSLAQAFSAEVLTAAQALTSTPTLVATQTPQPLPTSLAETATAVANTFALTSIALGATQQALQLTPTDLTQTAVALTATAAATVQQPPTPGPIVQATSSIPVVNVGCLGDEQIWFVPRRPYVGTHVEISVTSQRHHDVHFIRLTGPIDPGPVTERQGPLGFIWTWTVTPSVEDFHQWTFYADGLRPCITSGFNTYAPLGATPTPTVTPLPTNTPGTATATPTQTPVAAPSISDAVFNNLSCGQTITIHGNNFGTPPSSFGTFATLLSGGSTFQLQTVGTGSNTQLRVVLPTTGLRSSSSFIQVSNTGGDSNLVPANFAAATPEATSTVGPNTPTSTPIPSNAPCP